MKPENYDFGGGVSYTTLHPLVLLAMLLATALILFLPRRKVIVPLLLITFLVPLGQQIYVAGAHWLVLRIIILVGCFRLVLQKLQGRQLLPNGLNGIDRAFMLWALYRGLAPILLLQSWAAVPLQIAFWIQAFGGYFLLRYLIQDIEDVKTAAKTFALLTTILGVCMAIERVEGVNVFGYLGNASSSLLVRNSLIRARACFGHPILAGCFGATLAPLFFWLWKSTQDKGWAVAGMMGSVLMVFFSASSTPVLAFVGGIGALFMWPLRNHMRLVRWGIVGVLALFAAVMNAPVWFIVAHMNVTGASDASGRAYLIDTFIRHFSDWWLVGTNQTDTWGWSMWDLSNQFVNEGELGGMVAFVCFVTVICRSFGGLGKMRRLLAGDTQQEWFCWSLGAVLFSQVLAFFGVSYFDQTQIWWFAFLAIVSVAAFGLTVSSDAEPVEEPSYELASTA